MNQASINGTSLTCPRRIDQLPRHPELAGCPDSSTSHERTGSSAPNPARLHDQCQRHPALAVQVRGAIGFAAVVVLDTDTGPLFAHRGTSVSSMIRFATGVGNTLSTSCSRRMANRPPTRSLARSACNTWSSALPANGADGASDPTFRVEHAADQKFDEGTAGTWRNRHQEEGNPIREQQTNRGRQRHEGASRIRNDPHWSPRCSHQINPVRAARRPRKTNVMSVFGIFSKTFALRQCPRHCAGRECLNFRLSGCPGT